ncbi:hypothetical protein COS21_01800 [bacterium (Candidatus Gribaldobacteria) CG02_land_8_20_14_3_00_41_15]|uniref:Uncharacterized protein n=1 Tax=bacterium (Candidatus Gribaldobacteria) CG02_land_8_20_14_3_00_41_15 TaxID=2014270 RepID=A0A2M7DE07_9BACT|nr:MAG: hypothetical protein AUJ36_00590 [Parcubacteria group bacterium CG1_02_41_26]PIV47096.1 MAG: hypothetical protein COS21_01800 [bacterium (Candidatus Gribaldobacteria) CG02_land_8_20_14_3_00_41_15]
MNNETQIRTITNLGEQKLKTLIKESIKESIGAEILKLRAAFLPYVSEKEQKNIEQLYKKPSRKAAKIYNIEI